jgi:hypothetical protein
MKGRELKRVKVAVRRYAERREAAAIRAYKAAAIYQACTPAWFEAYKSTQAVQLQEERSAEQELHAALTGKCPECTASVPYPEGEEARTHLCVCGLSFVIGGA